MEDKINSLIEKYKNKIAELQRSSDYYEKTGRAGMCISIVGKIEGYNAVISDLKRLLN